MNSLQQAGQCPSISHYADGAAHDASAYQNFSKNLVASGLLSIPPVLLGGYSQYIFNLTSQNQHAMRGRPWERTWYEEQSSLGRTMAKVLLPRGHSLPLSEEQKVVLRQKASVHRGTATAFLLVPLLFRIGSGSKTLFLESLSSDEKKAIQWEVASSALMASEFVFPLSGYLESCRGNLMTSNRLLLGGQVYSFIVRGVQLGSGINRLLIELGHDWNSQPKETVYDPSQLRLAFQESVGAVTGLLYDGLVMVAALSEKTPNGRHSVLMGNMGCFSLLRLGLGLFGGSAVSISLGFEALHFAKVTENPKISSDEKRSQQWHSGLRFAGSLFLMVNTIFSATPAAPVLATLASVGSLLCFAGDVITD